MIEDIVFGSFVWSVRKSELNRQKHQIDFATATHVFADRQRLIIRDLEHSALEERWFAI